MTMATKVGNQSQGKCWITPFIVKQQLFATISITLSQYKHYMPIQKVNKKTKLAFFKHDSEVWTFYLHSSREGRQFKVLRKTSGYTSWK
jgi:hypothetical protein